MLTPEQFRQQLSIVNEREYRVVSMPDALELLRKRTAGSEQYVCITFDDGYVDNLETAAPILAHYGYPAHLFMVSGRMGGTHKGMPYLSGDELRTLRRDFDFTVGSHSHQHKDMSTLGSQEQRHEATKSREILEDLLGEPVTTFAYPFAFYTPTTMAAIEDAGYECAFTIANRAEAHMQPSRRYRLNRLVVLHQESLDSFRLKLNGALDCTQYYTRGRRSYRNARNRLRAWRSVA